MDRTRLGGCAGLLALLLAIPSTAAADGPVLLWMTGSAEQAEALGVEVAPRGARVESTEPPPGTSPGVRADAARGAARARAVDAALWLEAEADGSQSVRAVAPDSELTAWAPIPPDADARVIALIAASLLDELLAPATSSVSVRLRVPAGQRLASPTAAPFFAEELPSPPRTALTTPIERRAAQRRDFYVEVGPTFAFVAGGANLAFGVFAHPNLAVAAHARLTYVFIADSLGSAFSLSAGYVSDDDDGRFEVGLDAGLVVTTANDQVTTGLATFAYAGFGWTLWPAGRIGFRVNGGVSYIEEEVWPAGVIDFYLQVLP